MKPVIERTWEYMENAVNSLKSMLKGLELQQTQKEVYSQLFDQMYDDILNHYMDEKVNYLDRHKVAAIVMICIIKSNAIIYKGELPEDKKFFGQYLIAVSTGISCLREMINRKLKDHGKHIDELWFPTPLSCETPFLEIFSRNLSFADENPEWGMNPLIIAEELFILEYITLKEAGIDPGILKGTTNC